MNLSSSDFTIPNVDNYIEEIHTIMTIAVEDRALPKEKMDEWVTDNIAEAMDKAVHDDDISPVAMWTHIGALRFANDLHSKFSLTMPIKPHWNNELTRMGLAIAMCYLQSNYTEAFPSDGDY